MTHPDSGARDLEHRAQQRHYMDPLFHARVELATRVILANTGPVTPEPSPTLLRRTAAVALLLAELPMPPEELAARSPQELALEQLMTTGDGGQMTWADAMRVLGLESEPPR